MALEILKSDTYIPDSVFKKTSKFVLNGKEVKLRSEIGDIIEYTSDLGEICESGLMQVMQAGENDILFPDLYNSLNEVRESMSIPDKVSSSNTYGDIYRNLKGNSTERNDLLSNFFNEIYKASGINLLNSPDNPSLASLPSDIENSDLLDRKIRYLLDAGIILAKIYTKEEEPGSLFSPSEVKVIPDINFYSTTNQYENMQDSFLPKPKVGIRENRNFIRNGKPRYKKSPLPQFDGVLVTKDSEIDYNSKTPFLDECKSSNWGVIEVKTVFEVRQSYGKNRLSRARRPDVVEFQDRLGKLLNVIEDDFQLPKVVYFCYLRSLKPFVYHRLDIDSNFVHEWMERLNTMRNQPKIREANNSEELEKTFDILRRRLK